MTTPRSSTLRNTLLFSLQFAAIQAILPALTAHAAPRPPAPRVPAAPAPAVTTTTPAVVSAPVTTATTATRGGPASVTIGAVASSITSDGTTAIVATLKNADGTLYTRPLAVNFSSDCAATQKATLDAVVTSVNGIASAIYQPNGCTVVDTISAKAGTALSAPTASVSVLISNAKALSAMGALGKTLFFDPALSAAGNLSCASCHTPANAYLATNTGATPLGGASGAAIGFRTSPSAAYSALIPPYVAGANGAPPRGGLMWDGRATSVADQAKGPFTGAHEMANANSAAVLAKLLARPYLASYSAVFGAATAASNPDTVLGNIANAIGQFETEDPSFILFNSKFDAVQKNLASFTTQEANGQALFFNVNKAACAGCHDSVNTPRPLSGPQRFTDLTYRALAVPRNWALPYNNDSGAAAALQSVGQSALLNGAALGAPSHLYYDLGVCGPFRTDAQAPARQCGAFRVPSLRNAALKTSYFHNGIYTSLNQVINFYMTRDRDAARLYTKADGSADIAYNDLPVQYQGNRETIPPFAPSRTGTARLTATELQDLMTFLCTLTDGYDPQHPEAYRQPLQCRNAVR